MEMIYAQIKTLLDTFEFQYAFIEDEPSHQFVIQTGIDGFLDDIMMYLYVGEDQLLLTIALEKVMQNETTFTYMNTWNKESLLFNLFIDDELYLIVESYHSHIIKERIPELFKMCIDVFINEVEYFIEIKNQFIYD